MIVLTALIHAPHLDHLASTCECVFAAMMRGFVHDVVITGENDTLEGFCEESGALWVKAQSHPFQQGAKAASCEWVLCLKGGDVVENEAFETFRRFLHSPKAHEHNRARIRTSLFSPFHVLLGMRRVKSGEIWRRDALIQGHFPKALLLKP